MKARRIGFALGMLAALALAAGSEVVRARAQPRPVRPPTAEESLVRHLGAQVDSDFFMKRAIDPKDVARLMAFAQRGGNVGTDALASLVPLRFTSYHDEISKLAFGMATQERGSEAYSAISLLECWRDPRWRALAEAHTSEPGEWGEMFRQMLATPEE